MSEGDNSDRQFQQWIELLGYCRSESFSEEGLREIIDRRGLTHNHYFSDYTIIRAACQNKRVTEGIIRCLIEYFPDTISATDEIGNGLTPLHCACYNKNITLNIVRLLIEVYPDSVRSANNEGFMPLHHLCMNHQLDELTAIEILKLFVEKYTEAVRHANNVGFLPIHFACMYRSPEFCRVLIDAYPGSERITDDSIGALPLHRACASNTLPTVEYLFKLYPDAIHATVNGQYPIHFAVGSTTKRKSPATAVKVVQFLLDCDPNQTLKQYRGRSLLHFACGWVNDGANNIDAGIQVVKILFDAHPAAIEDERIVSDIHRHHLQVQEFINGELVYARQATNHRLMMTPDDNGQLPLHVALRNNARLGSIKLLVKGNPHALQSPDNSGALPLHIACQLHDSASVLSYLVELDPSILDAVDRDGNTAQHYACCGAKYGTIALLLEKYDAASVSKTNAHGKLPVDLLWDSNEVEDRESLEYTESVFRLLKAYPAMFGQLGQWGN